MGKPIARIRLELNRHMSKEGFFEAEECYVIGRQNIVDYLQKKKNPLILHYLVDEEDEKILMSRVKDVVEHGEKKEDRFHNIQYFLPREKRSLIVKSDIGDMRRMLTAGFYDMIYDEVLVK